jgi:hypothetical protein
MKNGAEVRNGKSEEELKQNSSEVGNKYKLCTHVYSVPKISPTIQYSLY